MKKIIILFAAVTIFLSCQSKKIDKKAELETLKQKQSEISTKIRDLEKEIALTDTTKAKTKLVEVITVQPQPYKHYIEIQGRVDADQNVTITPDMAGTIKAIYVREGDQVQPGQVLAEINDLVMRQSVEELKNSLALAQQLFDKQENLWKQNIGSEVQYLQAKNQKESLEKKMNTLKEQLELYKIKSSISGVVDEVMVKLGQGVAPGVPSFRVVNSSKLKVKADVAEKFSESVKEGSTVMVYFPDLNKEIPATVSYRSSVINQLNRTFTVIVNIDGNTEYRPNMIAVVKIADYQKADAMVVPVNTVQDSEEGSYVFVAENNGKQDVAKKKIVKKGSNYNGAVEILDGLQAGDKVITTGTDDLSDGVLLIISNPAAASK
jgi:membrane fusion protein (multidrug efflux system)